MVSSYLMKSLFQLLSVQRFFAVAEHGAVVVVYLSVVKFDADRDIMSK